MTLQEAKNEVAKKYGYPKWSAFVYHEIHKHSTTAFWSFIEEAAELYARSKWDEACDEQRDRCVAQFINSPDARINQWSAREYCAIAPKPEFKP
jgi:hypothetical protein